MTSKIQLWEQTCLQHLDSTTARVARLLNGYMLSICQLGYEVCVGLAGPLRVRIAIKSVTGLEARQEKVSNHVPAGRMVLRKI